MDELTDRPEITVLRRLRNVARPISPIELSTIPISHITVRENDAICNVNSVASPDLKAQKSHRVSPVAFKIVF
ncbi:hypothetical protein QFZ34_004775 [Phyllobacterium ifriqiyense]|uniref:Uncharacterized protein n=1 Tax=Phyllobacterium ifriqiyense TaxID=314238 RepID=A0ABU0SIS7_9HYPH|nr:hypothetical protein [Phyllobacterium ifriqiyense]